MEHLGYLRKLYEYGETLLADELNEIVLYINTSIETINILIDREYAINNGHCEVRYKNSAQLPTKPTTGSSGYSDGWSSNYTAPDTEHGEITWMSICFLNGNGEYGVWSSPVRITWGTTSGGGSGGGSGEGSSQGRDGEPGAFKSRVFKRLNTKPERPVGGSYTVPIPPGWYDGIPQGLAIIWSSVCTFYGDGTSSGWSDPAQESDTANLDVEFSPRIDKPDPPYGNTPFSNHEAEGWYDPNSPNFNTAGEMIWRAERKVSNGVYDGPWVISCIVGEGGEQGPPGKTGGHHETRYKNHLITAANPIPVKPTTGTDGTQNGWSITLPSLSSQDLLNDIVTFMTQCFVNEDGEYGEWTTPMRITGANGKDGEDGDEVEFIYTRRESEWANPLAPFSPLIDDWSGSYQGIVWTDNPKGVSRLIPYEYVCLRNKINGTWYPYSVPAVWSKFGLNGRDGDGVEYVFIRTASDVAPTITNSDDTYDGKTYLDDDYLPLSSAGRCTDNPSGGNHNLPYEWVAKRSKGDPDVDSGARIWHKYSGTMSLWSTFTENVVRLDLDNESDSMLYSSSKGLVSGYVTTTGYLFDGLRDVSAHATWSIYSQTGCVANIVERTVTVTSMGALSGSVVVQATYNGETYTATLTLKKIIDGDKYDLIIRPNAISYNSTTNTPANTTVTVEIWRTSVDGVRENVAPPQGTGGYSTYVLDGLNLVTSSNAKQFTFNVDNSEHSDLTVKISKGANSSEYLDCETIPICKTANGNKGDKGDKGDKGNDGADGKDGALGSYEIKLYAISARLTSTDGSTMPNDCNESSWTSTPPMTSVYKPYLWLRVRMYNPATNSYSTSWAYMRVTGEIGTPGDAGQTGLWYCYAGTWGLDINSVENTDRIGYYVQYGYTQVGNTQVPNFWMNIKEGGPNTNTPSEGSNSGWVKMQSDFLYIITKAVFSDYAQLGSFIINGDWFISREGKKNGSWSNDYSSFNSSTFPNSGFIPNIAIDAKTGKTYFNDANIKGHVEATSGTFTNGTFNGRLEANSGYFGGENGFSIHDGGWIYNKGCINLYGNNNNCTADEIIWGLGLAAFYTLRLGADSSNDGYVSDSRLETLRAQNANTCRRIAYAESKSLLIANSGSTITLPNWPDTGCILFVIPLGTITIKANNSTSSYNLYPGRIRESNGSISTLIESERPTIFVKIGPRSSGSTTYNCWQEFYSV